MVEKDQCRVFPRVDDMWPDTEVPAFPTSSEGVKAGFNEGPVSHTHNAGEKGTAGAEYD